MTAVANWSRLVRFAPAAVERPADLDAIVASVRRARAGRAPLRVIGGGHSFTPLVETAGTLLSLDGFAGVEQVDRSALRAVVRAGTRLFQLNAELAAQGVALENLGDIDRQSIAGAVATGTHGTGIGLGSLSTQLLALQLVTAAGEVVECAKGRDGDLFRAAQVSLGVLGVLARVTLRVVPAFRLRYVRRRDRLSSTLDRLGALRSAHRNLELYWFPGTDTVQLKIHDATDAPERRRPLRRFLDQTVMENGAFGLLCRACRLRPSLSLAVSGVFARFAGEGVDVLRSDRALVSRRRVRFQEMEYALPADRGADALRELSAWVDAARPPVCFPVELRFVQGDDVFLSPAHGRDSAYLAVHAYRGMEFRGYFDAAQAIFRGHGGRPHWGKLHTLTARDLAPLYPMWDRFQAVRRRLDPEGLFLTPYLRNLLGA